MNVCPTLRNSGDQINDHNTVLDQFRSDALTHDVDCVTSQFRFTGLIGRSESNKTNFSGPFSSGDRENVTSSITVTQPRVKSTVGERINYVRNIS